MRSDVAAFSGGVKGMIAGAIGIGAIDAMIDKISRISDVAERLGMSAESFERISYAAGQAGVDVEGAAKSLTILEKNLAGVDEAGGEAADALKVLGIDAAAFKELSPEEQMVALSKGYTEAADQGQALAAIMKLMGKGGAEMATLLSEGPEALKEALDQAVPATNEQVKNIENLGDKISRVKALAVPVFAWLVEGLMGIGPVIRWVSNTITGQFGIALDYLKDQFGNISTIIKSSLSMDWAGRDDAMKKYTDARVKMLSDMAQKQQAINERLSDDFTSIHYGTGEAPKAKGGAAADPEAMQKSVEDRKKLTEEIAKLEEDSRLKSLSLEEQITDLKRQQTQLAAEAIHTSGTAALEARKKELEIEKQIEERQKQSDAEKIKAAQEVAEKSKQIADLVREEEEIDKASRRASMTDEEKITDMKEEQEEYDRRSAEAHETGNSEEEIRNRIESKRIQEQIDSMSDSKSGSKIPTVIADDLRKVGGGGRAVASTLNPQAGVESRLDKAVNALRSIDSKLNYNGPRRPDPW